MNTDNLPSGRKSPSVSKQTRRAQMCDERKALRQEEANIRQTERNKRSPQEQLEILMRRERAAKMAGRSFFAKKERSKLQLLIEKQQTENNVTQTKDKILNKKIKN